MVELGKLQKPSAEEFSKGRKIFFVPVLYAGKESPVEYLDKVAKYWQQVDSQLNDLEAGLGSIKRIYHELVPRGGEEGIEAICQINEDTARLVKTKIESGACLEALEDYDTLTEFFDWGACLSLGLQSPKVFKIVLDHHQKAGKKRNEFMAKRLTETLGQDEIGLLMLRENHQVQFPTDITVFYVAPPALDDVRRWVRDASKKSEQPEQ